MHETNLDECLKAVEEELGRSVISSSNATDPEALDDTTSPDIGENENV